MVHFVLARAPEPEVQEADTSSEQKMADTSKSVAVPAETIKPTKVDDLPSVPNVDGLLGAAAATAAVSTSASCNMIVSRGGPLHSGTSEAFISCTSISASAGQTTPASPFSSTSSKMASSDAGNSDLVVAAAGGDDDAPSHNHNGMAAVAKTAANLSDLPVTVLLRVACYLADPVDRGSLAAAINKSFLSSGVLDDDGCSDTSRHLVDGGKSVKLSSPGVVLVADSNNNNNNLQATAVGGDGDVLETFTTATRDVSKYDAKKLLKGSIASTATKSSLPTSTASTIEHRRIQLNAIQKPVVPCI